MSKIFLFFVLVLAGGGCMTDYAYIRQTEYIYVPVEEDVIYYEPMEIETYYPLR